jgi:hypothetical protein
MTTVTKSTTSVSDERPSSKTGVRHEPPSNPGRYSNRRATIKRDDRNSTAGVTLTVDICVRQPPHLSELHAELRMIDHRR